METASQKQAANKGMPNNNRWYHAGLAFSCLACGNCCSGPEEGYVWVNKPEIASIARFLGMGEDAFTKAYLRRVEKRFSLIEKQPGKDCIFLIQKEQRKICEIYPVRPLQCRTWPFWPENLRSRRSWNEAAKNCPGMNRGPLFTRDRIDTIRRGDLSGSLPENNILTTALTWITEHLEDTACLEAVQAVYDTIDKHLAAVHAACDNCGKCCDFDTYGHRLYFTTLEMLYFCRGIMTTPGALQQLLSAPPNVCPYRRLQGCVLRQFRPAGCRIFYCRIPPGLQNELTEQVLARFQNLHDKLGVVYYYADLCEWLGGFRKSPFNPYGRKAAREPE